MGRRPGGCWIATAAEVGALSARIAWAPSAASWLPHPVLAAACATVNVRPRLHDGPGLLLAAIVDSIAELGLAAEYTDRDRAMLWASMLGPLVALTRIGPPHPERLTVSDILPDFRTVWGFYVQHPRVQAAEQILDTLGTMLASDDETGMRRVCASLGWPYGGLEEAALAVIEAMAESLAHRRASEAWDSGFGYLLLRTIMDSTREQPPRRLDKVLDTALHDDAGSSDEDRRGDTSTDTGTETALGALATRIRRALSVALVFPGRKGARYAHGPSARQLVDLVWLRWTDEDYLE